MTRVGLNAWDLGSQGVKDPIDTMVDRFFTG